MAAIKDQPTGKARAVLATNMKILRARMKLSQEDLALECELHRTFIAHVERCARNISLDNVEKIAKALHVPIHQLLAPLEPDSQ